MRTTPKCFSSLRAAASARQPETALVTKGVPGKYGPQRETALGKRLINQRSRIVSGLISPAEKSGKELWPETEERPGLPQPRLGPPGRSLWTADGGVNGAPARVSNTRRL